MIRLIEDNLCNDLLINENRFQAIRFENNTLHFFTQISPNELHHIQVRFSPADYSTMINALQEGRLATVSGLSRDDFVAVERIIRTIIPSPFLDLQNSPNA
jgi:hypothetical protein